MTPDLNCRRSAESAIKAKAGEWLLDLEEAGADFDRLEAACRDWRAEDPRHDDAFRLAERAWSALRQSEAARSEEQLLAVVADEGPAVVAPWRESRWAKALVPTAIAASIAGALVLVRTDPEPPLRIETPTAEVRTVALEDQSEVTVGARSAIDVQFTRSERRVVLADGQAFFTVSPDRDRPFVVEAGDTEVVVTGTKFDVWRSGERVRVSVLEGSVVVRPRENSSLPRSIREQRLAPGQVAERDDGGLHARNVEADEPGSWRTGRLYYENAALADVIADANRYSQAPIRLADTRVGALRVTTSFRTNALDDFLASLEATLPVTIDRASNGAVVVAQR